MATVSDKPWRSQIQHQPPPYGPLISVISSRKKKRKRSARLHRSNSDPAPLSMSSGRKGGKKRSPGPGFEPGSAITGLPWVKALLPTTPTWVVLTYCLFPWAKSQTCDVVHSEKTGKLRCTRSNRVEEDVKRKEGVGRSMKKEKIYVEGARVHGGKARFMFVGGDGGACGPCIGAYSDPHLPLPNESQPLTHPEALLKFSLICVIVSLRLLPRSAAVARQRFPRVDTIIKTVSVS